MGLDITAYKNIKKTDITLESQDDMTYENQTVFYPNPHFDVAGDIIPEYIYEFEEEFDFKAGSYGGYNGWRNTLAKVAGYPLKEYNNEFFGTVDKSHCVNCWNGEPGPFCELINFSDCEGVIGTEVSKKLLQDFIDFQDKAEEYTNTSGDTFWIERYNLWRKAFELASQNGAVAFH